MPLDLIERKRLACKFVGWEQALRPMLANRVVRSRLQMSGLGGNREWNSPPALIENKGFREIPVGISGLDSTDDDSILAVSRSGASTVTVATHTNCNWTGIDWAAADCTSGTAVRAWLAKIPEPQNED